MVKNIVERNIPFLNWLNKSLEEGYEPKLNLERISNLIDNLTQYYERKYSNHFQTEDSFFDTLDMIKKNMQHDEVETLLVPFRNNGLYSKINIQGVTDYFYTLNLKEKDKNTEVLFNDEGNILIKENTNMKEQHNLEELYEAIKNNKEINSTELEQVLLTHQKDLFLREQILNMVYFSLMSSKNNNKYKISKMFLQEVKNSGILNKEEKRKNPSK